MLSFVIFVFDSIELIKKSAKYNYGFDDVLALALLKLPYMIQTLLPFAVLLGALVVFFRLTKSRELVVIRSVGQSVWQFVMPLLAASFVIGVFNIGAFNPFAAKTYRQFQRMEDKKNTTTGQERSFFSRSEGLWLRELRDGKMYIIHADDIRQDKFKLNLRGFTAFEFSKDDTFAGRFDAVEAKLKEGFFRLENGTLFRDGGQIEHFAAYELPTKMTLGKIQENFASPETISFWDLPELIDFFESTGFSARSHRLHLQSLLTSPFLLMTMVLIAAVFGIPPNQRQGGTLFKIFLGVALGFLLYFISRVMYAFGFSGALPIFIAVWSPSLIFMLICTSILLVQEDG